MIKKNWAKLFNIGIDKHTGKSKRRPRFSFSQFRTLVANNSSPIHRTIAAQCLSCQGKV